MSTVKEELTCLIQGQPEDSSREEIVREVAFDVMVERGLVDSDAKRTISNERWDSAFVHGRNSVDRGSFSAGLRTSSSTSPPTILTLPHVLTGAVCLIGRNQCDGSRY